MLLLGSTGYVGATLLQEVLSSPNIPAVIHTITRQVKKVTLLNDVHPAIRAVNGDFSDTNLITSLAEQSDVIVEAADSDNELLVQALAAGARRRKDKGLVTIFIHVSGTGVLTDDARGMFEGQVIYTDGQPIGTQRPISAIPDTAFHRAIDLAIEDADNQGVWRSHIILPGTVFGSARGTVFDRGIANAHSSQIPSQVKTSLERGQPGMVGVGLNVWPFVHIEDLASHFRTIYSAITRSQASSLPPGLPHGNAGYYFATCGEYRLLEVAEHIGKVMTSHGWTSDAVPTPFTDGQLDKYYSALAAIGSNKYYAGTNSRAISFAAKQLGWVPRHEDVAEFYRYCEDETLRLGAA